MGGLAHFCWQSTACPDFGKRGLENLSVCDHYGSHPRRIPYCKSCGYRFSERQGTSLFDARLAPETIAALLKHIAEGTGVRKTARLLGGSKDAVVRSGKLAGTHAQALHDALVAFSPADP
jgi:transposase-like protein